MCLSSCVVHARPATACSDCVLLLAKPLNVACRACTLLPTVRPSLCNRPSGSFEAPRRVSVQAPAEQCDRVPHAMHVVSTSQGLVGRRVDAKPPKRGPGRHFATGVSSEAGSQRAEELADEVSF